MIRNKTKKVLFVAIGQKEKEFKLEGRSKAVTVCR